jgi:hypothetical protein
VTPAAISLLLVHLRRGLASASAGDDGRATMESAADRRSA